MILHADPDDLGHVPVGTGSTAYAANTDAAVDLTSRTGNAGVRVACGVVLRR